MVQKRRPSKKVNLSNRSKGVREMSSLSQYLNKETRLIDLVGGVGIGFLIRPQWDLWDILRVGWGWGLVAIFILTRVWGFTHRTK